MKNNLKKITFIGLGKMGAVLAKKLLEAGFDLTVYNRTISKAEPLVALGAHSAASVQEAVKNADIVITCLLDDNAVLETTAGAQGFLSILKPGAIHIGTSTIMPKTSKILQELHEKHGSIYLAGNVLGVPKVAEQGKLTSIVAGDEKVIASCQAIFDAYSAAMIHAGPHPYQANAMKICCNYFLVTAMEAMAEVYTFAEKNDLSNELLAKFFHLVYAHPAFKLYVDKIKDRNFSDVNFELSGGLKDLSLFQQSFTDSLVTPDIANVIKNKMIIAMAQGKEHQDWSVLSEVTREQAGLK
jgi:3-hydroxyisobutyrate dehydrogenase-like beta-hydroxyacid dehydrogenase